MPIRRKACADVSCRFIIMAPAMLDATQLSERSFHGRQALRRRSLPLRRRHLLASWSADRHGPVPLQGLPAGVGHRAYVACVLQARGCRDQGRHSQFCSHGRQRQHQHAPLLPDLRGKSLRENSARPGFMAISVGAVDDNAWFKPQRVVYVKDKPAWDVTATDIPNFDMMPPPPK